MEGSDVSEGDIYRPVIQECDTEGHVELILPANRQHIIMDEGAARCLAEDILRITDNDEVENAE